MGGLGESISTKMSETGCRLRGGVTHSPGNKNVAAWNAGNDGAPATTFTRCGGRGRLRFLPGLRGQDTGRPRPVEILVNNAGITRDMTFKKMGKPDWDAVMRTQPRQRVQHDQAGVPMAWWTAAGAASSTCPR